MSRRNPGEGHVSQRPDGRWQASLQVNMVRKVVYGKTEKEARKKLAELLSQLAINNTLPSPGRRTVKDLLDEWLKTVSPTLRPKTIDGYRYYMEQYVAPSLGQVTLSRLTPTHIQRLYTTLVNKGLTRSAAIVHARLHSAFKLAVLWNWLPDNPTERVIKPKHQYKRKDLWTQEELSLFLKGTEGTWLYPLWVTAISTGCRLSELLGLRWTEIDLVAGTMEIRRTLQWIRGEWVEGEPKTNAGIRIISLPRKAVEALKRQRVSVAERRLAAGPDWQDTNLVFTGDLGGPLPPSTPEHALNRICAKLEIRPVTPHGLRHLHASLLLGKGLPVTAVSQRLGHANPGITMTIYAHALRHQDDEAAVAIQAVLGRR